MDISLYQKRLDLQNALFSHIDHEEAMVAIVYKVATSSGEQLILKIHLRSNDFFREVFFLKHFSKSLPVPQIVKELSPEPGINGAILMECLPGFLLNKTDLTEILSFEIGSLLASIHTSRVRSYGDLIQLQPLTTDARIHFAKKFDEGFDECSENLPIDLLSYCRNFFDSHVDLLTSVDGPCITHRDFRPGNIIIDNGRIQGIIDWASARASFAEEDFCPLEHGEWPIDPSKKQSFLEGYASIRAVPNYSSIMPLLRLSRAIGTIGFTVKKGTWDNIHSSIYEFNRRFLENYNL